MAAAVMAARRISAMRRDEIIASEAFLKIEAACGCEPFTRYLLPRRSVRIARSTRCRNIGFERSVATSSIRGCW
jgi:hypothetical protein